MKIKVCGMRDGENIRQVSGLGVDYIGLIFWSRSPRHVTMIPTGAGIIPDRGSLSSSPAVSDMTPQRVGVFVDEMPQSIITRVVNFDLSVVQLHGHETPTMIRNLRRTIDPDLHPGIQMWKAISISPDNPADLSVYTDYEDCVDAFVFDTKTPMAGGSGQHFDWSVLDAYEGTKPYLLSGGIGPDDAERIKAFMETHPQCMGIDLNSRFESAPAQKDIALLRQFLSHFPHQSHQTH